MTFEEILDQAIAMLQRRGRLTYSTLKRQFQLDEDALNDLKDEIIYGQRLAVDEEGRVLVWTGSPDVSLTPTVPAPPPAPPEPPRAPQAVQPPPTAMPPAIPPSPEAERRQLTVLFCDLVGSTALSAQLDPEDLREVVRAYQSACAEVIQRLDGHLAQHLGDGLLVYFGYPQAHEDDAPRAVRAGLGIVSAMETLNTHLEQHHGVRIAVRLGIHTGLVVVGAVGSGNRQEQLALGETPNVAARLQGFAAPNTVVISAATFQLVRGYVRSEDLGTHALKGLPRPVQVYRILGESAAQSRLDAASTTGLTPLVGRQSEVALLLERWDHSQDGTGQTVLLRGEAGIGKSRLVEVLRQQVSSADATQMVFRCSPYHQQSALYPVIDHLQRFLQWQRDESPEAKFEKLERMLRTFRLPLEDVVPLFAALLSISVPERYAPLDLTPQRQRQKTQEVLVAWLLAEAQRQPVLAVWEDLHWADPSTLEFLDLCIAQTATARLLTLLTCRPEFQPTWAARAPLTQLTLTRLSPAQVESMVAHLTAGKALPAEVLQQVMIRTDGVPLFIEELVKMLLESELLREEADRYALRGPLPLLAIPATVQDSLMARLDRLSTARTLAQLGAVLGREFGYEVLQAVAQMDDTTLQRELGRLVEAELLYQRGQPPLATYRFKHALIQDTAYQSLLKSTRQQYHQRIAQVLEIRFPERGETQPELLAHHYTEAGLTEQAIGYWQRAGQQASERSAHQEAISHLTTGIELLKTLPETPGHTHQALSLHIALGAALQMTKGNAAPEVERAYTRARELCQQVGETPELVPVLFGLWRFYMVRSQLHTAREIGETLLRLAQPIHEPALAVVAHHTLGLTWFFRGVFPAARSHLAEGSALYTPDQRQAPVFRMGYDLGVGCRAYAAWPLWLLGYPDQALAHLHASLTMAHELAHPFSLAFARGIAAFVYQFCRDVPAVYEQAEATVTLSTAQGFASWVAMGTILQGWVLAMQGQGEEGLAKVRWGIAAWRSIGAALGVPYFWTVLADVCDHLGHLEDGLQALAEAHTLVEQHEERWWEAEVCRLRGVLLLRQTGTPQAEAEAWMRRALDIACRQQAKSLELRAAMSLARLWQQQGKCIEARQVLAEVYGWFTEGFDTVDLQEAKTLLGQL
jgi:class 3 adenylate cyclase/predicted ATPase